MVDKIKSIIEELQTTLKQNGKKLLKIDGIMGKETYEAVLSWQKNAEQALKPTIDRSDWRLAKCLQVLRAQLDLMFPERNKLSDGAIGDTVHQTRQSDHNPWIVDPDGSRVVSAVDITNDPVHGVDCAILAARIKDDPRVKYVIWNKRIYNAGIALVWRSYTGENPHDKHMHVSVKSLKKYYDDEQMWKVI